MRGRGFSVNVGFTTLHLHTTSIASDLLLIAMGVLLATYSVGLQRAVHGVHYVSAQYPRLLLDIFKIPSQSCIIVCASTKEIEQRMIEEVIEWKVTDVDSAGSQSRSARWH